MKITIPTVGTARDAMAFLFSDFALITANFSAFPLLERNASAGGRSSGAVHDADLARTK